MQPASVAPVSAIPYSDDVLPASVSLLQLPDVAKLLGVVVTRVHQMLRDHQLVAIRRDGYVGVPEAFFGDDDEILRMLPGVLSVMHDGGYTDAETLRWLFTDDDTLRGGSPVQALRGDDARDDDRQ